MEGGKRMRVMILVSMVLFANMNAAEISPSASVVHPNKHCRFKCFKNCVSNPLQFLLCYNACMYECKHPSAGEEVYECAHGCSLSILSANSQTTGNYIKISILFPHLFFFYFGFLLLFVKWYLIFYVRFAVNCRCL